MSEAANACDAVSPADADTAGPRVAVTARRLVAKLVVAAGIAAAGWLLVGALGGGTASAEDSRPDTGHSSPHTQSHSRDTKGDKDSTGEQPQRPGLVGTLTGGVIDPLVATVNNVTGTVTSALPGPLGATVQNTLTMVTGTVTKVTDQVAATTDAIVRPIAGGVVQPIVDKIVAPVVNPVTHVLTPSPGSGTTDPGGRTPSEPVTPAVPATAPAEPTETTAAPQAAEPATVVVQDAAKRSAAAKTQSVEGSKLSTVHAGGHDNYPAPLPSLPGGSSGAVTPAHDNGGSAKSPLDVTSTVTAAPRLASDGLSTGHALDDNSREAALPTTSPD